MTEIPGITEENILKIVGSELDRHLHPVVNEDWYDKKLLLEDIAAKLKILFDNNDLSK